MITINQAPATNKIILDANTTIVSVTSTNGIGYYFRALIYIDDVLFDTQSWSRFNNYTATVDLKKLYNAYFETVFPTTFTNGLEEQTHLKKKVSIVVQERLLSDDSLVTFVTFQDFYILYNRTPVAFSDATKIEMLGVDAVRLVIPANGKISIPFFANTDDETIVVTLTDNFGTVLNTQTIATSTSKKIFLYQYNLSDATLAINTTHFNLSITVGAEVKTKVFRFMEYPDFTPKEVAFTNNFGFYQFAYLDGQLTIDNNFTINSFEENDGTETIYEINEEYNYAINSGTLFDKEKNIITQIATSFNALLYFNNEWITLKTKTKKVRTYQDRMNNYSENLSFSVRRNYAVENDTDFPIVETPEITLTSIGGTDGINYNISFSKNFTPLQFYYQTKDGADWNAPIEITQTSPQDITPGLIGAAFDIRLFATYNEVVIYSNTLSVDEILIPALIIESATSAEGDDYDIAFSNNFAPTTIYYEIRTDGDWSTPTAFAGTTSPQTIAPGLSGSGFEIRLSAEYSGSTIYSETLTVPDFLIPELILNTVTTTDSENFEMDFTLNWEAITIYAQVKAGSTWDTPIPFASVSSPQTLDFSSYFTPFYVRLLGDYDGATIYSNEVSYGLD